MQILPGLLAGVAILFLIVKPGDSQGYYVGSSRIFLDPIDHSLGKRSCSNGYVKNIDHFILTGFINATGYEVRKMPAYFSVWFLHPFGWYQIWDTIYNLRTNECTGLKNIPPDQCRCQYESSIIIRLKCNITARVLHKNTLFVLNLISNDGSNFSTYKFMDMVYRYKSCSMAASTNGGTSSHVGYNGMPGLIFLVTALVCIVTSMVSNGQ
ncbi:unnamed protein product [Lymnaea stagnalis]|uniref:Uncharacterized protein n=1 Tax=Lymnaea stagnalis TaxID=6523 RepID=A0AAV2HK14_LYMST